MASMLLASTMGACAQTPGFEPSVGQAGKDVVWVPTPDVLVNKMLDMAKVTPADYLIDLGSGDGRTVITAAKRGVKSHGIEYNPEMVKLSQANAAKAGVSDKATFAHGDIFQSDFSQATVITLFLLPSLNVKLRPTLLNMKAGTRVVSNSFNMSEWEADETVSATSDPNCTTWCTAFLWIVPAKVGGTWRLNGGGNLTLKQEFQKVQGSMTGPGAGQVSGRLRGDQITFKAGGNAEYSGRVVGNTMEGTFKSGNQTGKWTATRGN
jgi:hypothetical protein